MAKKTGKKTHGGPRPGSGRPRKKSPLTRKTFTCGNERWESYGAAANAEGFESIAEWIRHHLDLAMEKALTAKPKATQKKGRIE